MTQLEIMTVTSEGWLMFESIKFMNSANYVVFRGDPNGLAVRLKYVRGKINCCESGTFKNFVLLEGSFEEN